jgi:ferredoxin
VADQNWRVEVDREACMGSGMCIVYAPGSFEHDDETKAVFQQPPGDALDAVRTAIEACPTGALTLIEDDGTV